MIAPFSEELREAIERKAESMLGRDFMCENDGKHYRFISYHLNDHGLAINTSRGLLTAGRKNALDFLGTFFEPPVAGSVAPSGKAVRKVNGRATAPTTPEPPTVRPADESPSFEYFTLLNCTPSQGGSSGQPMISVQKKGVVHFNAAVLDLLHNPDRVIFARTTEGLLFVQATHQDFGFRLNAPKGRVLRSRNLSNRTLYERFFSGQEGTRYLVHADNPLKQADGPMFQMTKVEKGGTS